MESLRCKMQKHRTTRKLLQVLHRPPKPQGGAQEDRRALDLQRRLTHAVSRYGDAVESAFEALLAALEDLEQGGLGEVDFGSPILEGLVKGLYESHSVVKGMVRSMAVPLEVHSAAVAACLADITKADHNSAELRRYQEKVEGLAEESEHETHAKKDLAEVRLQRNRGKLQAAEREAAEAEAKVEASLRACLAKQASLEEMALGAVAGTVEALHAAVAHLPRTGKTTPSACSARPISPQTAGGARPVSPQPAGTARRRQQEAVQKTIAPPPPCGSLNPFDIDIQVTSPAQDSDSPPRSTSEGEGEGNQVEAGWNPFEEDVQKEEEGEEEKVPIKASASSQEPYGAKAPAEPSIPAAPSAQSLQTFASATETSQAGSPQLGAAGVQGKAGQEAKAA